MGNGGGGRNAGHNRKRKGEREDEPWTHDRGLERGVRELGRARAECGREGEGVREFSRLVLRVVEGEGDGSANGEKEGMERRGDEWGGVWREEVEESVRAVERLLRGES